MYVNSSQVTRANGWDDPPPSAREADFDLSNDQRALRDAARDLLDGLSSAAQVRSHTEGSELYDRALSDNELEASHAALR